MILLKALRKRSFLNVIKSPAWFIGDFTCTIQALCKLMRELTGKIQRAKSPTPTPGEESLLNKCAGIQPHPCVK